MPAPQLPETAQHAVKALKVREKEIQAQFQERDNGSVELVLPLRYHMFLAVYADVKKKGKASIRKTLDKQDSAIHNVAGAMAEESTRAFGK